MEIVPLPPYQGVGFTSLKAIDPQLVRGYRHESVGAEPITYHNYHFTLTEFEWPEGIPAVDAKIDGFSPNLNKTLHIGHLRNLVLGSSLVKITGTTLSPVAMLGASLGFQKGALTELEQWYKQADYHPIIHLDVDLIPQWYDWSDYTDGVGELAGCKVTRTDPPVVVRKSNGQASYAAHDLAFAAKVKPTHYVTAAEQSEHFKSIGLGNKHLPMGIVLGEDGKKMSSRNGTAFYADGALQLVSDSLLRNTTVDALDIAWNVIAWNFLSAKRTQNLKFIPDDWANPDKGGLYITYTHARVKSALDKAGVEPGPFDPHPVYEEIDLPLLGLANYFPYYIKQARNKMDPCPVAVYAFELAKRMGKTMEQQRVIGGTFSFQCAMWSANNVLKHCMELLTMKPITVV